MRQRITVLTPLGQGIDPKTIEVEETSLTFKGRPGATVEKRVTWSLNELPSELANVLRQSHELHVRWTRESAYNYLRPLVSRLPVGLHIHFTPLDLKQEVHLCPLIGKIFGQTLKCHDIEASFSSPPILSERFAQSASFQYHQSLTRVDHLIAYIEDNICSRIDADSTRMVCERYAQQLRSAVSFDADFDTISHALTLTIVWRTSDRNASTSAQPLALYRVEHLGIDDRVEVGVLSPETSEEPEELKLGGYLTVLGEDTKPAATLFSFPSRHHPLPRDDLTSFNASLSRPTGLHPTMIILFQQESLKPPRDSCALHAYLTLPSALFVDRYQFSDPAFLNSSNLRALHALSGAEDLEAPDWTIDQWGSASLFELAYPQDTVRRSHQDSKWEVRIPLHLRYMQAENNTSRSYKDLQAAWPITFWACEAEEGLKMATNPFDRVNLGYDGLFGPKTMFYHIPPAQQKLVLGLEVPVMEPIGASWTQTATFAVVILGFSWILSAMFLPIKPRRQHMNTIKTD